MTNTAFQKAWKSYQHFLNIEAGGKDASRARPKVTTVVPFTCHQLRHTLVTRCFGFGVDLRVVQEFCGHADMKVTSEVYAHLSQKKIEDSVTLINEQYAPQKTAIKTDTVKMQ